MMKKTQKRPKTSKQALIKPLNIDSQNNSKNSKMLYQKGILDYYDKLRNLNISKNINNNEDISLLSSIQSKPVINNNNNAHYFSLNSTSTENNNIFKSNNTNNIKKTNSYAQYHNSFYLRPKLKSRTFRLSKEKSERKISTKNKIISLRKNKKFKTEDIKFYKGDLLMAAYKNNPEPLLESIFRKTNQNKELIKENEKNVFNYVNNRKKFSLELVRKNKENKENKEKRKLKINKISGQKKIIIMNKNYQDIELIQKNNNNNLNKDVNNPFVNNKKIEHCIAINNNCYNPILQYLDNSDYIQRNRIYRSKTENIDDIKNDIKNNDSNTIIQNKISKTNNNFWLNFPNKPKDNPLYNKINLEEKKSVDDINKIKKKVYADASSDTSLDNILPNKFKKRIIKKESQNQNQNQNQIINKMINNTNINLDLSNNKNKVYVPKYKLYKNSKYFNKFKRFNKNEDRKCNPNISDVNYYNFKDVVDLFGKKIELCKKPKIHSYNNFRNNSCKYYSCSNNVNITFLRKNIFKNKANLKYLYPAKPPKNSIMDFIEDIDASIAKKI